MDAKEVVEKIRRFSRDLMQSDSLSQAMDNGVRGLSEATGCAVIALDQEGAVLSSNLGEGEEDNRLAELVEQGAVGGSAHFSKLLEGGEPRINEAYPAKGPLYSFIPISGTGKSTGGILASNGLTPLEDLQLILLEVGAALTGMILLEQALGRKETDARNQELAEVAFESLSYSEVEAIREILKNINNNESVVVASKIADSLGITRSVIVNALRKFESAGIIESRSLGMKGTFIRVKNLHALELIAARSEKMGTFR